MSIADEPLRSVGRLQRPSRSPRAIATFDAARNAYEARDTAQELVRNLLRYLLAVALATHAQVREGGGDPVLLELTGDGSDGLDPILALHAINDRAGVEELVRVHLVRLVPEVTRLLRRTAVAVTVLRR